MELSAAPIFYLSVVDIVETLLMLLSIIVQAVALVHCLTQRGDAFQAIGTLPKGAWAAILAITIILTYFVSHAGSGMFSLIGIGFGMVYLLDVRPGLKDASDGHGPW